MTPPIRLLFFASAREATGKSELDWPVASAGIPVADLLRALEDRFPGLSPILPASRFVRNGTYLRGVSSRIRPGDEFAVHPPYSGG
ncbi:MAG: MoaD/ThiS family protein [Thermoplasmata archaeon]|nr:MoaD/ThiS family protein [Thermoplasmata archaeon]